MLILRVFIQDVHKRMVGFKAYTEENLVWEKEQNMFILLEKQSNFAWSMWYIIDLNMGAICRPTYRGADKSLARPGRKQATATEDFVFHISYL
jgi:hypothetical protein